MLVENINLKFWPPSEHLLPLENILATPLPYNSSVSLRSFFTIAVRPDWFISLLIALLLLDSAFLMHNLILGKTIPQHPSCLALLLY